LIYINPPGDEHPNSLFGRVSRARPRRECIALTDEPESLETNGFLKMKRLGRTIVAIAVALASLGAISERPREPDVTDTEIRIGNLMPYTGELSAFGAIGRAEAAYFDMINERGGINGHKVRFISYDDKSDPSNALDLTRGLVERDNVLLMFGSFGTEANLAVRKFLNERQIPQLFVASGDDDWSNPSAYHWTIGWQPSFRSEGRIYANYVQAFYPQKKIVVLWENDQFGRALFRGLQEGLGRLSRNIIVDIAYEASDAHLDTHMSILKQSGADILVFAGVPADAARAIRIAADLDWHPVFVVNDMAASIATALKPAGLENSLGVISTSFLKDMSDPAWKDDPAAKAWRSFVERYYPGGDKGNGAALFGYAAADTLAQVLKQCGDDLSRENVMRQATRLADYQQPVLLPGITISTAPSDFRPIKQMRLIQFDGSTWQPIGDVVESTTIGAGKR
jgi:ABC-type branched-subunit amino acid transport system substrate-binding protein